MFRRTIAALALACATVSLPGPVFAQGILNTERFQLDDVEGYHAGVDLAVSGAAGNTRYINAMTSGIVGYRGERHWLRLMAGARFLADRERRVFDDRFAQLRYSFVVAPALEWFQFVQYQANRSLLLENRWLVGGGIRAALIRGERTALRVGTGLMYEDELRDRERLEPGDEVRLRTVRLANHAVLSHRTGSGATLLDIVYIQPAATALSNVRLLNDLGLHVPLGETVGLNVSLEWRHDSRPPASLHADDLSIRTGVSVDVR